MIGKVKTADEMEESETRFGGGKALSIRGESKPSLVDNPNTQRPDRPEHLLLIRGGIRRSPEVR
jgi:hypothetical protein